MPSQPPIPPDARPPYGPEGAPKTFTDVKHRVRHAAERSDRGPGPEIRTADPTGPLLKLAAAAFFGYVLGTVIHRRAD